ncbi:MAG: hypothetical protein B5M51_04525 [Anaerolinea sp. 4484_236]|nr:MAG: hypothetical protein B5M51_04525 [Anaerolinea sp. 4484_236]
MIDILTLTLGPVQTNSYIVADTETNEAVVIDPAWDGHLIAEAAQKRGWQIKQIWYTHAHFDHIAGAAKLAEALPDPPSVALHPAEYDLWQAGGGARLFGFQVDPGPKPTIDLEHGQTLTLGSAQFEVRLTPGHRPGHCVFYCSSESVLFSGDLIFYRSVGRTDLPGGNWSDLEKSIREQIYTLPTETRILSGHGDETSVGEEKVGNPFVGG